MALEFRLILMPAPRHALYERMTRRGHFSRAVRAEISAQPKFQLAPHIVNLTFSKSTFYPKVLLLFVAIKVVAGSLIVFLQPGKNDPIPPFMMAAIALHSSALITLRNALYPQLVAVLPDFESLGIVSVGSLFYAPQS